MKKEKSKKIKECLSYKISVEGENCEALYFEHLQELINDYEPAKYKVSFDIKPKNPLSFAKSRTTQYAKKGKKTDGYINLYMYKILKIIILNIIKINLKS